MRVVGTAASLVLLLAVGAGVLIWSGVVSVAANDPHLAFTRWIIETARIRSIRMHAANIVPPGNLADPARVVAGTAHFADHCAMCHSAPGVNAEDMADGMYPKPPALTNAARHWTPGELFWILQNGIKMSGMPAWSDHGDAALWNIVAFLEKLPGMSGQKYAELVKASDMAGGHQMRGPDMKMDVGSNKPGGPDNQERRP